jgi:hypothetical protein
MIIMTVQHAVRLGGFLCCSALFSSPAWAGANLVVHGDFETPSLIGINSDYIHTPGGNSDEGTWWVNPWDPGGPWFGVQHTPGGAGAMSVNGDNSARAGQKRVWYQVVPVTAGEPYAFSTWALATAAGFTGYSLQFAFDGVLAGPVITPTQAFTWEEFSTVIVPTDGLVEISIVNVSGITFPNDFMLDDIALIPAVGCDPTADLNDDGFVNGADLGLLLGAWDTDLCEADLNEDGLVDGADLGLLLAAWTG